MSNYTTEPKTVKEASVNIAKALSDLSATHHMVQRKLVNLLYKKGYTQQEIADHLGITRQRLQQLYPRYE